MRIALAALLIPSLPAVALAQGSVPTTQPETRTDWVDAATGHRVIRLSTEPGTVSPYFHQNPFTDRGDKMLVMINTPGVAAGPANPRMATIDLTTLGTAPCKNTVIATGPAPGAIVGKKTRTAYYSRGASVLATHLDTGETREIGKLPEGFGGASGWALNSDETMMASTANDPEAAAIVAAGPARPRSPLTPASAPNGRGENARSMVLFTVTIQTGEVKKILHSTSWLNHTQFSPTDPRRILYCHEGDWHMVDRTWTIFSDGTGMKMLHPRTMQYEIEGHEFFSHDGQMAWYDLQTPRSVQFWLAGVHFTTGERIRYPLERVWWSVHYNQSPDGKLFSGDGGGPNSVANRTGLPNPQTLNPPGNGMWMYLFTPQEVPPQTMEVAGEQVKVGKLAAERLVNLSMHNYSLEPNGIFTPDSKWLIFRSNMSGVPHTYAVEIRKSN